MRKVGAITLAAVLAARYGAADTEVRRAGDKVDVRATAAPVSEVLDRLARETGMKVTYDGPPPRARISVTLNAVTPVQAVLSVLEGLGLSYALRMDPGATRVETLLMVAGSGGSTPAPAVPRPQPPAPRVIEREPDTAEPEEDTPTEAPVPAPDERRPGFPGFPVPSGPAMPLQLPTPPPAVAPSPGPPTPQTLPQTQQTPQS